MNRARLVYGLVLALTVAGCATILSGTSQTISVNSNVDGAEVYLDGSLLGTTPLTATVQRPKQDGTLRVEAEGYRSYQQVWSKTINTMFWVNILSGGTLGSSTDYSTGAMYAYEPATLMVSLQPENQSDEGMAAWQRREGLRGFVLMNNEALVSDLAAGDGEYIDVLVDVLAVAPSDRAEAIERWRAGYAESETAAEFAERLVAELDR